MTSRLTAKPIHLPHLPRSYREAPIMFITGAILILVILLSIVKIVNQ